MPRTITSRVLDFAGGLIGGVSEYARKVRHARVLENMLLRPLGGLTVRNGSQRLSSATLQKKPHTVAEWVTSAGVGHIYVGCEDTAGALYEATAVAFTQQTTPYPLHASAKQVHDQLHGSLFLCEQAGGSPPIFYNGNNPANKFHSGILPRPAFPAIPAGTAVSGANIPAGAVTAAAINAGDTTFNLDGAHPATGAGNTTLVFGSGTAQFSVPNGRTVVGVAVTYSPVGAAAGLQMTLAAAAGGAVDVGAQPFYRIRFRYLHGSGRANLPLQLAAPIAGPNQTVAITNIANEIRSDYLGWTLERTKIGGTITGPFYFVANGTGAVYNDTAADATLGDRVEDNLHGEPVHFDGIIAFKDRLVAWVGSVLWYSQSVASPLEFTGICNWNALRAQAIGPDDGDTIMAVVPQADRLIVLKRWSVWGVEGDDIDSFRAFPLAEGMGASGPRSAAAVGQTIYFYGPAGFHRIVGNSVEPFGWTEVGHIFDTFRAGQDGDVRVLNYLGQYVLVFFASLNVYNDDCLVYDLRFRAWSRITGWKYADALVQKAGSFGNQQAIVAIDRSDRDATAGFDYPVWLGFYGFKDEKASNGSGGVAPVVVVETPFIDDGAPDTDKDWETVQVFLSGDVVVASFVLTMDPQRTVAVSLSAAAAGSLWGSPNWGAFSWGVAADSGASTGIPLGGAVGRRYSARFSCTPAGALTFKGYTMDGKVLPKRDYSRV